MGRDLSRHFLGAGEAGDLGQIGRPHALHPVGGQLLDRHAQRHPHRVLQPQPQRALQQQADGMVAVLRADERPQRLPEPVRQVVAVQRHLRYRA